MKEFLKDNWEISGNDLNSFIKNLKELKDRTEYIDTNTEDLSFYYTHASYEDKIFVYNMQPYEPLHAFSSSKGVIKGCQQVALRKKKELLNDKKYLVEETLNPSGTKLLISAEGKYPYFVNKDAISDLFKIFKVTGSIFLQPSIERTLLLAKASDEGIPIMFIARKDGTSKKIFSTASASYSYGEDNLMKKVIKNILEQLNSPVEYEWKINHKISVINIKLPQINGKTPVIQVVDSLIGASSFYVNGLWDNGKELEIIEKNKRRHSNSLTAECFNETIKNLINKFDNKKAVV